MHGCINYIVLSVYMYAINIIRASVDALCRDGAGITCLGKASKLEAPEDISLFKHLTKLYQLYSS